MPDGGLIPLADETKHKTVDYKVRIRHAYAFVGKKKREMA